MKKEKNSKILIVVVSLILLALFLLASVIFLPGQGGDTPQNSTGTGAETESTGIGAETGTTDTSGDPTGDTGSEDAHVHQWTETVTPPTCTEGGYTTFACSCGESYTAAETEPLGHEWKAATCTDPKTCARCEITDGRANGHGWDAGEVTKEATEEEDGEKLFTCTVCDATKTQLIPSKNHIHSHDTIEVVSPTCTEGGYTTHTCGCGDSYTDSRIPAAGHGWKDATCTSPKTCTVCGTTEGSIPGHSWKDATCTEGKTCTECGAVGGSILGHDWKAATCAEPKTCSRCGATEGEAAGHSYTGVVTKPTQTEQGYTTYTCSGCGDSYQGDYTNLDGKQYTAGTLVFRTDAIASLYGEGGRLEKTYTGWDTASYNIYSSARPPWYEDREKIKKVIIDDGVSPENTAAWFYGCVNLTEVTLGNGVTQIGDYAFYGCRSLAGIQIPSGVTGIGGSAFASCYSLTNIRIPSSVIDIKEFAFSSCTGLISIAFAEDSQLTGIGRYAFSNCEKLTSIHIPATVSSIGDSAFSGCHALASMTVAAGNPVYYSQGNCIIETATKTLVVGCKDSVIPSDGSVTAVGSYAFANCDSLTKIHIPAVITKIDASALSYCDNLATITVDELNPAYMAKGNCLIRKADSTLVTGCKSSVIPSDGSVTHIGSRAFTGNSLTAIHIPANITRIDDYAFSYCEGLITVTFADGSRLDSIGDYAFEHCRKLTDLVIPSSVIHIGSNAFDSCYGFKSVTFAENSQLVSIGHYAFGNCAYLESIRFGGTVDRWHEVAKDTQWCHATLLTQIVCTDGNVAI